MSTVKIFKNHIPVPILLLLVVETSICIWSVYVGVFLRFGELSWQTKEQDIINLPLKALTFAVVMLLAQVAMGQYQARRPSSSQMVVAVLRRVATSLMLGTFVLLIVYYLLPFLYVGRGITALALIFALFALTTVRIIFFRVVDTKILRKKILVLGTGKRASTLLCEPVAGDVVSVHGNSYFIVGFIRVSDAPVAIPTDKIIPFPERLSRFCLENHIDEIVLAMSDRRNRLPLDELLECKMAGISIIDKIAFIEREQGILEIDLLQPSWMIFCDGCQRGALRYWADRSFDIITSLTILLLTLPLILIATVLIFCENGFRGPIFYSQIRVGLEGRHFKLHKFRSMKTDAEKNGTAVWAQTNDPRITWIGRIIRKLHIDELPQVLNILVGDMSIVGPRPERPEFVDKLNRSIPFYDLRHKVKPGLAGWAQLKYPYGADECDAKRKLEYDLYYLKNSSLPMNILVLLQTLEVVLLGKGAR